MAPDSLSKRERRDAARQARQEREAAAAAAATRRRRLIQLGGLLAVAVLVVVVAVVASSGGGSGKKTASTGGAVAGATESRQLLAGIPQHGVTLGRADAPVTIVEFADPQCPFCKQYTLNDMPQVVQRYVRTGKAKMELRMLSFIGDDSVTGARALAGAAQQDKLFDAADVFYSNQGEENSGYVTDAFLRKVLGAVPGLDVDRALKAASSPAAQQQLGEANTLASRYGVDGTPTVLVGPTGGALKATGGGVPSAKSVSQAIDAALAKSSSGT